jgi:hypothetical protein
MKKVFSGAFIASLSLTAIMFSCQKPEETTKAINSSQETNTALRVIPNNEIYPVALNSLEFTGTVDYSTISINDLANKHNECMQYIANKFKSAGICPMDNEQTKLKLEEYLEEFLRANGLITDFDINSFQGLAELDNIPYANPAYNFSVDANSLLSTLEKSFNNFTNGTSTLQEFESSVNTIILSSSNLSLEHEKRIVELTATICKSSAIFWKQNYDNIKYTEFYYCQNNNNQTQNKQINWYGVANSDASGAVTWGVRGFVATLASGPGSVGTGIACGFAGACGHSAARLLLEGF